LNFLLCRPKIDFLRDHLLWASKEKYERKMGHSAQIAAKTKSRASYLLQKRRGEVRSFLRDYHGIIK
ncbi:MAG: hypothetical protein SWH68_08895, partial [Thermodesulfobacteriota bacterium]|nr:hypothetical protein [Thermodesulfobacteriota bacterium]